MATRPLQPTATSTALAAALLVAALLLISWASNAEARIRPLPDRLHCSSILYLFKKSIETGPLLSFETFSLEYYQVDEYVDLPTNRSSLSVYDGNQNDVSIFYNELSPSVERGAGGGDRKFVGYEPLRHLCRGHRIGDWPLAELRKVAINMADDSTKLNRQHIDVSIGPSGLLYAIQDDLEGFEFRGTIMSESRLTLVDVYRKQFMHHTIDGYQHLMLIVHVMNRGKSAAKLGDSLSKVYDNAGDDDDVEVVSSPFGLNIALVGACQVTTSDDSGLGEFKWPFGVGGGGGKEMPPGSREKSDLQLDEDTFCERDQTLFVIHYNVVAGYQPGTLVGKSLEQLGETAYDFHREPFMQPTGMGCWSSLESDLSWQKSLTRGNSIEQLSAEYVTESGPRGVAYVAYDRERALFRFDRTGRKSVYDLLAGKSYHVGEFSEPHELLSARDAMTADRNDNNANKPIGFEQEPGRCVVLDMSSASQLAPTKEGVIHQLMGLRRGVGDEHYLGSRQVDHVNYEVFERELDMEARLPVMLQMNRLRRAEELQAKRRFLTYYAQSIAELASGPQGDVSPTERTRDQFPLLLSFIELWEFDTVRGKRKLLNRLEFLEFSWQLDVEPANDARSQRSDANLNMRVFDIEPCYLNRAGQAELVVDFRRDEKVALTEQLVSDLHQNRRLISEQIHQMMASTMDVSPLNLADFKLKILKNSGNLVASTRLVELQVGLADLQFFGVARFLTSTLDAYIQRVFHNRHSLEECQLDSLAWSQANWFAHCQELAICVLLEPKESLMKELRASSLSEADRKQSDLCYTYSLRYASQDASRIGRRALKQADSNYWDLNRRTLELKFRGFGATPPSQFDYTATPRVHELKQLDSIGFRLKNEVSLLAGMRYSTRDEAPGALNLNVRVAVPPETRLGTFRFCQLACQMDDLCGSFSVCLRNSRSQPDDCVLASIRLTSERIDQLIKASPAKVADKSAEQFEVKMTNEHESQVLAMFRDENCFMHPKDFVAEYEISKSVANLNGDVVEQEGEPSAGKKHSNEQVNAMARRHLSLDDCAGLNFERTLFMEPSKAVFTFCALDSNCVVAGDELADQWHDLRGYCYQYRRQLTHAYEVKRMSHLLITRNDAESAGLGEGGQQQSPAGISRKLDPFQEAERMDEQHNKLVRKLWSLDEQGCARECNLHKSKCLAFDTCRQGGKTLCILYSIRSPLAKHGAYLPQLEVERSSSDENTIMLVSNMLCNHHLLKPDYFEVRLKHLLELEKRQKTATDGGGESAERDKRVNEMETQVIDEDKRQSEAMLKQLEAELAKLLGGGGGGGELNADQQQQQQQQQQRMGPVSHANKWFHFVSLVAGLLLGALTALYRQQIAQGAGVAWHWYQARNERPDDNLNNRLVLDDPFT